MRLKTIIIVIIGVLTSGTLARAEQSLARVFAKMYSESHPPQPRYRTLHDGAPPPQIRQLKRQVGRLMRILRGYSFLSQMGGDWANYQMATKIHRFKRAAVGIERDNDLRGRNWVSGSELSRWQFLCKAITRANRLITNPDSAPSVTQQQKVESAARALGRALHMIRYKELRPWANGAQVDRTVNKVLWAPVGPPQQRPGVVIVDNSTVTNVDQRSTRISQVVAPVTVSAPRTAVQKLKVNAAPGSVVSAGQELVQ